MQEDALTVVELFSGPGGLGLGFHLEGFKTLVAYDYENDCVNTYKTNFPNTKVIQKNLASFTENDFSELFDIINKKNKNNNVTLVMGGPPCRSFSTSNPKKKHGDNRDFLYEQLIKVTDRLNAKYFIMENVEDITTKSVIKNGKKMIFHRLLEDLQNSGLKYINFKVLNSDDFGVPQSRERIIIIATKYPNVLLKFPKPITHEMDKKVCVFDAFEDLPKITCNSDNYKPAEDQKMLFINNKIYYCNKYKREPNNDFTRYCRGYQNSFGYMPFYWTKYTPNILTLFNIPNHSKRIIERYNLLKPNETQGTLYQRLKATISPNELDNLIIKKILPKKIFKQKNRRLIGSIPSNTVTSHAREELVHPNYNRNLTPREVARLQSFPDWYIFKGINQKPFMPSKELDVGTGRDFYQQIGDAVPPLLAAAIAREIKSCIKNPQSAVNAELRENLIKYIWENNIRIHEFGNFVQAKFNIELSDILSGENIINSNIYNEISNMILY